MKRVSATIIFFILALASYSQSKEINPFSKYSPNVASLGKYVDLPVTEYNGMANISIPLYTITDGEITVPISLSYHSGGIRVNETATRVGLGWTLNAGGVIIQNIRGIDDCRLGNPPTAERLLFHDDTQNQHLLVEDQRYLVSSRYSPIFRYYDHMCRIMTTSGGAPKALSENIKDLVDTEADIFTFNFNGYTGKFIYDLGNKFILLNDNSNLQVGYGDDNGFEITTPEGLKYSFTIIEETTNPNNLYLNNGVVARAFLLTKIQSPTNHNVIFKYNEKEYSEPSVSQIVTAWLPLLPTSMDYPGIQKGSNNTTTATTKCYELDSIVFSNGCVVFNEGNIREDIIGNNMKTLMSIDVKSSNNIIKHFDLHTSTYYSGLERPEVLKYSGYSYLNKRLLLNELKETVGSDTKSYKFIYNSFDLPPRQSFSQDYWGYFNNKSNLDIVPKTDRYLTTYSMNDNYSEIGGDRNPDSNAMKAGILTQIQWPTKGVTKFEFEPNTYKIPEKDGRELVHIYRDTLTAFQATNWSQNIPDANIVYGNPYYQNYAISQDIIIGQDTVVEVNCIYQFRTSSLSANHYFYVLNQNIYGEYGINNTDYTTPFDCYIQKKDGNGTWHTIISTNSFFGDSIYNGFQLIQNYKYSKILSLSPGTYRVQVSLPRDLDNNNDNNNENNYPRFGAEINLVYGKIIGSGSSITGNCIGGGLRIKNISFFDADDKLIKHTNYSYKGGQLMSVPMFVNANIRNYEYEPPMMTPAEQTRCKSMQFVKYVKSSNSFSEISTSAQGGYIGYDTVIVTNGMTNGRIETIYYNKPDQNDSHFMPYNGSIPYKKDVLNGNPKFQYIYSTSSLLKKIEYKYEPVSSKYYSQAFVDYDDHPGLCFDSNGYKNNQMRPDGNNWIYYYPLISQKTVLNSQIETDYPAGSSPITQTTNYTYYLDSCRNQMHTKSEEKNNGTHLTTFKYPQEKKINSPYKEMTAANFISNPVQIETKIGDKIIDGQKTEYYTSNWMFPKEVQKYNNVTNYYDSQLWYDQYDSFGNLLQYHKTDNLNVCYLWGYNNQYPVAEIKNLAYNSIPASVKTNISNYQFSRSATITNIKDDITFLKTQLASLLSNSNYLITLYTYKPLVGISSMTDPRGVTTYYQYDSLNRLQITSDANSKKIQEYQYNYKQ